MKGKENNTAREGVRISTKKDEKRKGLNGRTRRKESG